MKKSLIDDLLTMGEELVNNLKKPLQKKRISRGLDSALDSLEGKKIDAESKLNQLRLDLVKASTEQDVVALFNSIAKIRQELSDIDNTINILTKEKNELYEERNTVAE